MVERSFFVTGVSEIHFNDEGLPDIIETILTLGEMVYEKIPVLLRKWLLKID